MCRCITQVRPYRPSGVLLSESYEVIGPPPRSLREFEHLVCVSEQDAHYMQDEFANNVVSLVHP